MTDFERLKNIIVNNYTYTIEKKFRIEEDYDEDYQNNFEYVYEFWYNTNQLITFHYNLNDNRISFKTKYNNYRLDFNNHVDRSSFNSFLNSFNK